MNASKINKRLKKLEQKFSPEDDGTFTLEELCRAMWREDQRNFLGIAADSSLSLFARQFECEDVERGRANRQIRRRE